MLGSVRKILFLLVVGLAAPAFSVPFTFTYSGRLLDTSTGNPITGTRSIKITFWTAQTGGSQLAANQQTGVTNDTYSVSLVSGVFSQVINLSAANFHTVFPDSTTGTWVQVQDMTAGTTYPRQQFTTVPYALKVPVDGTTVTYNSSGQLQVSSIGSASLPATINTTTVTASSKMGIGTTSPSSMFEVLGSGPIASSAIVSSAQTVGLFSNTDGTNARVGIAASGAAAVPVLDFRRTLGTAASPTAVTSGQNLGQMQWWGYDGTQIADGGRIMVFSTENWTSTARGTDLRLRLNPTGSTTSTEVLRVTGDGNVGIGATSPAAKLDVAGEVKLGNTASTCSGTTEGSIRYNSTLKLMEFCNGTSWAAVVQEGVDPAVSGGRLTVVTGSVSVPNTTGATTLYYTPAVSNKIALYNGTNWRVYTFSEFSLALSGLTSGKNYDVFVYLNNGSPALELGSAWTNDTTRASNLAFNSVYTKSGDANRKYVGTIRTTGTTTTEDSDSKRFVWNFYNQRPSNFTKHTTKSDSNSAVWGYSTQAWRAFNNDTTGRVEYVTGFTQSVYFSFSSIVQVAYAGLCFDCTNSSSVTVHNGDSTGYIMVGSRLEELPGIGYHFAQATEHGWNSSSGIGYITISGMIHN